MPAADAGDNIAGTVGRRVGAKHLEERKTQG